MSDKHKHSTREFYVVLTKDSARESRTTMTHYTAKDFDFGAVHINPNAVESLSRDELIAKFEYYGMHANPTASTETLREALATLKYVVDNNLGEDEP
jgi:hypothetical protein